MNDWHKVTLLVSKDPAHPGRGAVLDHLPLLGVVSASVEIRANEPPLVTIVLLAKSVAIEERPK